MKLRIVEFTSGHFAVCRRIRHLGKKYEFLSSEPCSEYWFTDMEYVWRHCVVNTLEQAQEIINSYNRYLMDSQPKGGELKIKKWHRTK